MIAVRRYGTIERRNVPLRGYEHVEILSAPSMLRIRSVAAVDLRHTHVHEDAVGQSGRSAGVARLRNVLWNLGGSRSACASIVLRDLPSRVQLLQCGLACDARPSSC